MPGAAEISLGLRVAVTKSGVRAALWESRVLVRTYGLRGTIHIFPSSELPLWLAALQTLHTLDNEARLRGFGLDIERIKQLSAGISDALDGRRLTIKELGPALVKRLGPWVEENAGIAFGGKPWPKWRIALGHAAHAGNLCFGPPQRTEVTLVRPDQWLGLQPRLDPDIALREVFRRFLHAYGPATTRDFAQWFALPHGRSRKLAAELAAEVEEVDVEGSALLALRDRRGEPPPEGSESVLLLPHFDSYLRGFHPRAQLAGKWAARTSQGTGQVPVLLLGGRVAGLWEQRAQRGTMKVRVEAFEPLSRSQVECLKGQVVRIGEILESTAILELGPVSLRPHL